MAQTFNGSFIETADCTVQICSLEYATIEYVPSLGANATYLACLTVILIGQLGFGIRHRIWGFLVGMFLGLVGEIIGYAGRLMLHDNPFKLKAYIM